MARIFFTRSDLAAGTELWVSDGIAARRVKDIFPGANSASPSHFVIVGDKLFFTATDGVHGTEIWQSDGTDAGTFMIRDIRPGPASAGLGALPPAELTDGGFNPLFGDRVFFSANDGTHGYELWLTNGSESQTSLVKDIIPGPDPSFPSQLTNVNGTLFFAAGTVGFGQEVELWMSDGTDAGTVPVKDISPEGGSFPDDLTSFNGVLIFSASQQVGGNSLGRTLWISDGTDAGTKQISNVEPSTLGNGPRMQQAGGLLFFAGNDHALGFELWKTNGTEAGTALVADIRGGPAGAFDDMTPSFTNLGSTVYFLADDGVHGRELWASNGTAAGMVKDINPGSASIGLSFNPSPLVAAGGKVFFFADDGVHGRELWNSDGTEAGTVMVKDITPGSASSAPPDPSTPFSLIGVGGTVYFGVNDAGGSSLWKSDGSEAGTVKVITGFSLAHSGFATEIIADDGVVQISRLPDDHDGNSRSDLLWAARTQASSRSGAWMAVSRSTTTSSARSARTGASPRSATSTATPTPTSCGVTRAARSRSGISSTGSKPATASSATSATTGMSPIPGISTATARATSCGSTTVVSWPSGTWIAASSRATTSSASSTRTGR